jgi:AraC-like DNA-binding protein
MPHRNDPLGRHPVLRSKAIRDVESYLSAAHGAIVDVSNPAEFNFVANRYDLPNSQLWFYSFGTPVTVDMTGGDFYRIQFHYKGGSDVEIGGHTYEVTPHQAVVSAPPLRLHCGPNLQSMVLRISRSSVMKKLSTLIEKPLIRPLEFITSFDSTAPRSRSLKQIFDFLISNVNTVVGIPSLVLPDLEQSLIAALLCSCIHNYTNLLFDQPASAAPWQVRRVEDYIEANWNKMITIEDIVDISGSSARSIFRAFKESRGYSPMAFVKQVRLRHAQEALLDANEAMTVTQVALACGFSDLGRFSKSYGEAFGELPSETLKRRRQNSHAETLKNAP